MVGQIQPAEPIPLPLSCFAAYGEMNKYLHIINALFFFDRNKDKIFLLYKAGKQKIIFLCYLPHVKYNLYKGPRAFYMEK